VQRFNSLSFFSGMLGVWVRVRCVWCVDTRAILQTTATTFFFKLVWLIVCVCVHDALCVCGLRALFVCCFIKNTQKTHLCVCVFYNLSFCDEQMVFLKMILCVYDVCVCEFLAYTMCVRVLCVCFYVWWMCALILTHIKKRF